MSCKVGNQTNSQDPQAVNSRVFVGNLNTFQCSKTDVERMFQRYGRIAGISMHKGYAFIQFTNPFDARSACLGEDGRLLWGQTLDVNMVAEPKAHQTGRKRQNMAKTGNDWDYYYDSYYAQVGFPTPRLVPPMKRPRLHVPPSATPRSLPKPSSPNKPLPTNNTSLADLKSYSTPDILICGNCRELFSEIEQLMEHKKTYCKLRFTCKCHMLNGCKAKSPAEEPASLLCSQCKDSFHSAWDLMVHVQAAHMLNIYQLSSIENSAGPNNGSNNARDLLLLHDGKEENGGSEERSMSVGSGSLNGDLLGMEDSSSSGGGGGGGTGVGLTHSQVSHLHNQISHHHPHQLHHQQQQQQQQQQLQHHQQQLHLQQQQQQSQYSHQQQQQQQQQQHHHTRENSTSSTASSCNLDGHCSPCDMGDNNNEILMDAGTTSSSISSCTNTSTNTIIGTPPERQMNGNMMMMTMGVSSGTQQASSTTTCTSVAAASTTTNNTAAFPMEASTQTQTFQTDNPSNFDEHCALLSAMKAAEGVGAPKHVPFNGQPAGV